MAGRGTGRCAVKGQGGAGALPGRHGPSRVEARAIRLAGRAPGATVRAVKASLCMAGLLCLTALPGLGAEAVTTNLADLPYAQLKEHFERDESMAGARITARTVSSVTVSYQGRYLVYETARMTDAQRARIEALLAHEKVLREAETAREHEGAARAGMLREVEGVTYNLLKPPPDWVTFQNVKVLQKTEDGLLVDLKPRGYDLQLVFVKHLPQFHSVADGDTISFTAKQTGTYTYITRAKVDKTVRQYDCGTVPGRSKAPAMVRAPGEARPGTAQWDSSGTGFFITGDGYLVTCHHVVDGGRVFSIRTAAGTFPARVVATDASNDVAILKVAGKFPALAINTNGLALGQAAFTIGFPNIDIQGLAPKYTDGKVSSLSGIRDDAAAFQISVPVQPGNSGGPLTDAGGNVIGIVVARLNDYAALKRTRSSRKTSTTP